VTRLERLRATLEEPLLVSGLANVRYLTGFESSNAGLVVEPDRVRLFTDFRYAIAARAVEGVEAVEIERNLLAGIAREVEGRIGFEAHLLTYAGYETLREAGLDLVPRRGLVEAVRSVKDDGELDTIRRAAAISDRVFEGLVDERFSGRTERELVWRVIELLHDEGANEPGFEAIVAAGPTGAVPHAHPGDRTIGPGETVVIDLGARLDGYTSDCTRTFAVGGLEGPLAEAYLVCLEAQVAALDAVRPGVAGRDVDAVARRIIDGTQFKGLFGHGLGHGVGMEVHEAPTLRAESDDVLEPGNVVTVEPGIYLEGQGGIRIEDLVVVTEGGSEILTSFPKELTTVS
jgi:Xaa-Pro aminopeptidase